MKIVCERKNEVTVVGVLAERIDAANSDDFKTRLHEIVSQGNRLILLDISQVKFVDSSGLGALISVLKTIGDSGVLAVCRPTAQVTDLFRLTRMDRIFTICDTEANAMDLLRHSK